MVKDCEIKDGGRKEGYAIHCTGNEGSALDWFRTGTWKLKGLRGGVQRRTRLLGRGGESDIRVLFNCQEKHRYGQELVIYIYI